MHTEVIEHILIPFRVVQNGQLRKSVHKLFRRFEVHHLKSHFDSVAISLFLLSLLSEIAGKLFGDFIRTLDCLLGLLRQQPDTMLFLDFFVYYQMKIKGTDFDRQLYQLIAVPLKHKIVIRVHESAECVCYVSYLWYGIKIFFPVTCSILFLFLFITKIV